MNRILVIVVICITFFACKPGIPNYIIQPDRMEKILFDIHVVDGYLGTLSGQDTAKKVAASYYKGIYKKFDIDSAAYVISLNYYYKHPDVLNKIYGNLSKRFEQERKKNDKRMEDEAMELRKKELIKSMKVLVVPTTDAGPPKFTFSEIPFTLPSSEIR